MGYFRAFILSGIITILSIEGILRILGIPKSYQLHTFPPQFERVANPRVVYVNKPSASIEFVYDGNPRGYFKRNNTVDHVTNERGFRGPDFSDQKPKNIRPVAIFPLSRAVTTQVG